MDEEYVKRFWEKVDVGEPGECWEWKVNSGNYTMFRTPDGDEGGHRIAYRLENGSIPEGSWVLHKCDNPPCVNPDHLFVGDHSDNMKDMYRKGRGTVNFPHRMGEECPWSKLDRNKVVFIHYLYNERGLTSVRLGEIFDVHKDTILAVLNGVSWTHIYERIDPERRRVPGSRNHQSDHYREKEKGVIF